MRRVLASVCAALSVMTSSALAGSLPEVPSGVRPGPTVLYEPPPAVPELGVRPPFRAEPLLVSGTDAYRDGEYLYQDYLFDDRGADARTPALTGGGPPRGDDAPRSPGQYHTGDVAYPTDERFAANSADLVEFRVRPTRDALVYRITLNTVLAPELTAVGIGIDTGGGDDAAVAWPHGAGLWSPGLEAFITAWGTGGDVTWRSPAGGALTEREALPAGSVSIDTESNQMIIRVPRSVAGLDPRRGTWRYVIGAGLWAGAEFTPVGPGRDPRADQPVSGHPDTGAPAIFNAGFRFDEPGGPGGLYEDEQARVLAEGTTGPFFSDVDFGVLEDRIDRWIHPPPATQVRILASRLDLPEGFHDGSRPSFGGRLQPYGLHVPAGYDAAEPRPLTVAMHGAGGTYAWGAHHPNFLRQVGDARGSFVLSPQVRGLYFDAPEAFVDLFETWADVARQFALDPEHVALSGYSAGGYHTFRFAIEYPDLFGRAFPMAAAARNTDSGDSNWLPMLGNLRWVPWLAWNGFADPTALYAGIELTRQRAESLGLRHQVWGFPTEHTIIDNLDRWDGAAAWLGEAEVARDPWRIDYAITPSTWFPEHGLVADHAYWASGLRVRADARDNTGAVRGHLTALSRAFGDAAATVERVLGVYPGPPLPATIMGAEWGPVAEHPPANELELDLRNLRSATLDGRRARLRGDQPLGVAITSDGEAVVSLEMPLAAGTRVVRADGSEAGPAEIDLRRDGARFHVDSGTHRYRLEPRR